MWSGGKRQLVSKLLFNHMDAWVVALITATLAVALHDAFTWQRIIFLMAVAVGYWLAFAFNDYCDAPFDAWDGQKGASNFFVQRAGMSRKWLLWLFLLVNGLLFVAFAQFGRIGVVLFGMCVFILWAYSARPLRLKSRPGFDLFVHALFVETFPYLMGLLVSGAVWTRLDVFLLSILFLYSLSMQIWQEVRDFDVDSQWERNFVTQVGRVRAVFYLRLVTAVIFLIAVLFVAMGAVPLFIVPLGLIAIPIMLRRFTHDYARPVSRRLVTISTTTGLLYMGVLVFYLLVLA